MSQPEADDWQRLDPRMLLVHPIREVVRFLPALLALFVAGSATDGAAWQYLGVLVPVALGVLRYLTTSFRISHGRVELRRGLLSRHVASTPLDRVRTVDLTSPLTHRLLGLTTVRIGAGTADDGGLDLDGLPVERARGLRAELLREAPAAADTAPPSAASDTLRFDPRWARFAPLTSTGVVIGAGVLGVAAQGWNVLGGPVVVDVDDLADGAARASVWAAVPILAAAVLVTMSALAVGGYLVTCWGLTLRHTGRSWHLSRGLVTTRETTIDDSRLAGVTLGEPVGLRLAGGSRLSAIVTGVDRGERGSALLVPPAPYAVVADVAARVLGTAGPISGPLVPHGPQAVRRRWSRALSPVLLVLAGTAAAVATGAPTWLLAAPLLALPVAAALAADRARALGHALVDGRLVARSGSLTRRREVLGTGHVIGWTFRDTWFQRRSGLTTLVATTAGGRQAVTLPDVPHEEAVRVADAAIPGLVAQFLDTGSSRRAEHPVRRVSRGGGNPLPSG
ncbi:PH domain-containing protein [Nocardioides sp. W7]|uniref:PH domain-containing protein n=1 Tax=Nocardioides sp. W7 TaxID=2931390 RepID=UPI001FD08BCA|nr:PH domain-containing protein [Nocardioides sp. W7]